MSTDSKPFNVIFEGEWNDVPCADYPLTPERWVAETIRPLVNTHVDTLFYNLCSSDGYVCELKSGTILMDNFEKLGDAWVWRYRENTKKLVEAGANPPDLAVEYGRRLGLKVLPVVRMNDPHDQFYKYEVSDYKRANPQLLIGHGSYNDWERGARGHPNPRTLDSIIWGMFDFAHQEVRDHRMAIIEEFITRWDNDGVCLDFERDPWYFKELGNAGNAALITDMVRSVREILDRTAQSRGRPQYLHVRVLPDLEINYQRAMDLETWVTEGLVDAISPGAGYMTFSQDLKPWLDLVADRGCWIYPVLNIWRTPQVTRGWAKLMLHRGAHGLYLFNWGHLLCGFGKDASPQGEKYGTVWYDEVHPCYYDTLKQIGDPRTMATLDATYELESVSHDELDRNAGANRRRYRAIDPIELPIEMSVGRHRFTQPCAEDLTAARQKGFTPRQTLRLMLTNYTVPDRIDVSVNGTVLDAATRSERAVFIMNNDTWIEYPIDGDLLKPGNNQVEIDVQSLNPQMAVAPVLMNAELVVNY